MQHKHIVIGGVAALAAIVVAGCAGMPSSEDLDRQTAAMLKASFSERGIAKMDRLDQDLGQKACSSAQPPSEAVAKRVVDEALATIKMPSDGRYIGDWKAGEKLAQNGRGMSWSDKSAEPSENGGSCYNCHQISKQELSYGSIGPSLYNYGKLRGVKDVADPASKPMIQYTWAKIWNSKAFAACSDMPRFGHAKLLDESQIRDVMALLLDPQSPVNQ
jgi:sulfur-oxidizing protein SoxX